MFHVKPAEKRAEDQPVIDQINRVVRLQIRSRAAKKAAATRKRMAAARAAQAKSGA